MRILYCNKYNFPFSGTEVYLFQLMQMMREQGHEVALFSMADTRGLPSELDRFYVPKIDFKERRGGILHRARLGMHAIYSLDARRRLGEMVEAFRPDVAHVRNIYHHLSPSILWELRKRGIPVVYHLNDFKLVCPSYNLVSKGNACNRCKGGRFSRVIAEGCYSGGRAASFVLSAEAYIHRWLRTYEHCVDRFLAPSEFVRSTLVENGWPAEKIEVLPHFQEIPEGDASAPEACAPILYFGRLSAEKGVADLLLAMQGLPHIRLKIAGDGPIRTDLEALAQELGLGNVTFLGHVQRPDLDRLIAESRFTVLPSRAYETLGKSILESYAQSRAVVASDLGSRREFVRQGETGLLYSVGNIEELDRAISQLYQHPQLAEEMGRCGREFVRRQHSPARHYAAITHLYECLVQEKASSARTKGIHSLPVQAAVKPQLRVAFIGGRGVIGKYSGIESYYEEVGSRLAQAGHEVTIYCRNYFTPPQSKFRGMRLVRLPTVRSKHFETVVHTLLSTAHVLVHQCDIVHYHTLGSALFAWAPRLAGKKTVVSVQGLDWQRKKWGRFAAAVLRVGERASADLPDATIVVSRTLQAYYGDRYGLEPVYIPNGAVLRKHRPPSRLRESGIEPGNYILFLGRFSPEKNCQLLIDAYKRIGTKTQLVLAGGAGASDEYANHLYQHASERIRFLKYASGDAFEELLTNAMLFVLPSDLEGLSLALLEAMAAGLCVLTSDIPENLELVEEVGFTFRKGNQADLERMLRLLIADGKIRKEAGYKAKQRVREGYLWPRITQQVEEVYLEIMGWDPGRSVGTELPIRGVKRRNAA